MTNPADEAAAADARFKAAQARADAGNIMNQLTTKTQQYKKSAEQTLARGMVSLAMSGNLGFTENTAPGSSGAVGSTEPESVKKLREAKTDRDPFGLIDSVSERATGGAGENSTDKTLDVVGTDVGVTIEDPSMLLKASGSDLLTLMNTREAMQTDINTFIRSQKDSALTMLKNAGHYDSAAASADAQSQYDTINSILGWGFKIAGLVI